MSAFNHTKDEAMASVMCSIEDLAIKSALSETLASCHKHRVTVPDPNPVGSIHSPSLIAGVVLMSSQ